ncbi:MAG: CDP-diacylglycerol--glycerol-3-phosphate 3-phosphatidyltransferase [Candidatus Marinimicrobia bacterium CG08_land_8_20_14_0_20_45_22]|nr:MAG: CDP-diacylglycerol--glycerol-3-phosphate 3-phosphatidyltransferase [Candidatus Marinimicrobia bacterium CG08_land_8_20_14_0_20_45_22]
MKQTVFTIANFITTSRILLTPLFIYFLFGKHAFFEIFALIIFIIASVTDAYDGYYARKYQSVSSLGKFLDPLADKVLMSAAFISFVILDIVPLWMVILVILRDFVVTGLRILMEVKETSMTTSHIAKIKTGSQIGVICFILVYHITQRWKIFLGIAPHVALIEKYYIIDILMFAVTAFTVYTGVQYIFSNFKYIKKRSLSADEK